MASHNKQEILENVHSMAVEYCLFNGSSYNNLMNAITRDIYPTKNPEENDEFHLNIKRCRTTLHHKYNQHIHIAHFSQLKWITTLPQRPNKMLPTAHHLILFFNYINIPNIDINLTQSILEEFIVQCLISMDPEDTIKWNQYLKRYCTPFDFCCNYKALNGLSGKSKRSKEFEQFKSKHSWKMFINKTQKWCFNVLNELQLTPNKAFLTRLTEGLNNNKKIQIEQESNDINNNDNDDNMDIDDNDENEEDTDDGIMRELMDQNERENEEKEEEEIMGHGGGRYIEREIIVNDNNNNNGINEEEEDDDNDIDNDQVLVLSDDDHIDAEKHPDHDSGMELMSSSSFSASLPSQGQLPANQMELSMQSTNNDDMEDVHDHDDDIDDEDENENENENDNDNDDDEVEEIEPIKRNTVLIRDDDDDDNDYNLDINRAQSMPSLEMDSQQIEYNNDDIDGEEGIESTQEDDYDDDDNDDDMEDNQLLDDLNHINNDKDQTGLFAKHHIMTQPNELEVILNKTENENDINNSPDLSLSDMHSPPNDEHENDGNNGSMDIVPISQQMDITTAVSSQNSDQSTPSQILLQSQAVPNGVGMDESQYPAPSQPAGGFNFGAFAFNHNDNISPSDLVPTNDNISDTASPPENNSILPSQIPIDAHHENEDDNDNDDIQQQQEMEEEQDKEDENENENDNSSPFIADYLSQNKPPSHIGLTQRNMNNDNDALSQNRGHRGRKRTYDEMEHSQSSSQENSGTGSQSILTPNNYNSVSLKRPRISHMVNNEALNMIEKKPKMIKSDWPIWMKKGIEVTVELEDELLCAKIRKVATQFVLVKIFDDDAPSKYHQKQFKIYLKDKDKIEPIDDIDEIMQSQQDDDDNNNNNNYNDNTNINNNHQSVLTQIPSNNNYNNDNNHNQQQININSLNTTYVDSNNNNTVSDIDKAIIWQYETERASQDNIASPPELSQEQNNKNRNECNKNKSDDNNNNNNNDKTRKQLQGLLKPSSNGDKDKAHNKRVQWNLTLSQETKQNEKEQNETNNNNNNNNNNNIYKRNKRLTNRPLRAGGRHSLNNVSSNKSNHRNKNNNKNRSYVNNDNNNNNNNNNDNGGGGRFEAAFEDRENNKDNGCEMLWDSDENDEEEENQCSIYKSFKPHRINSKPLPPRITNEELIKDPFKFCGYKDDDDEEEEEENKNKNKNKNKNIWKRKRRNLKNGNNNNHNHNENASIRKKLGGGKVPQKRKKSTKTPWTAEEIEAVIEGYEKYQDKYLNPAPGKIGIWGMTKLDPKLGKILSRRGENRMIKDKWRNLVEKNDERIQHLLNHKQRTVANMKNKNNKNNKGSPRKKMPKLPTRPIR